METIGWEEFSQEGFMSPVRRGFAESVPLISFVNSAH